VLAEVERGEVKVVIIAKLDRLTRSVKDLCTLLERFSRRGVTLIPVAGSLDTGSAAGRLVLNIMTAVSQWEREAIGERTRNAMSHKLSNGECVGNIRYGYRLCADGKHVEPDMTEQRVLTEIRGLRESGKSMRGIAAILNHGAMQTHRGSDWRLEHVARILKQNASLR
jgi:site-specific DNA recombinase